MTRLFVGYKTGVGGVVKVMRNDGDNPLTTPNNQHGRFLFNSETTKIGYVEYLRSLGFDSSVGENSYKYYPSGTNSSNCYWAVWRSITLEQIEMVPNRIVGRSYPVVCEVRPFKALGQPILGPGVRYVNDDTGGGDYTGHNLGTQAWWTYMKRDGFAINSPSSEPVVAYIQPGYFINDWFDDDDDVLISILDLPIRTAAMPTAPAGTSGTRNAIIRPDLVRIAKGGVSAETAARDSVIIDSTRVPAKVVRAGQVNVPANGTVSITSPVTLTTTSYMDYMVWETGETVAVPQAISGSNVENQNYNMSYTVFSNRVEIHNDGNNSLTVRYMICMDDNSGETSGGSAVMRRLPDGNIQLKRPGSSDSSPRARDILLDTRFSYLPIVSEGYLSYTEFTESPTSPAIGGMAKTITFPNDGSFLPFVKYYVDREIGWVTHPYAKVLRTNADGPLGRQWDNTAARDSTVAVVTNSSVKFHMARNNPYELRIDDNGNIEVNNDNDWRPVGIRYYIFAIPTDL